MQDNFLVSNYTAIRWLLYSYLLAAVDRFNHHQKQQSIISEKIPLYKGRDNQGIFYISGVALRFAKLYNQDAIDIAGIIASQISGMCKENLLVKIVAPGCIHLELTDGLLALWLQNLVSAGLGINVDIKESTSVKIINPSRLFAMQYAYSRCCSLLFLAQREGLIQFREPLLKNLQGFSLSVPIPWLNAEAKLRLNHPVERGLISELIQVVDNLIFPNDDGMMNWEKVGFDLSQAFEAFWSHCRIWGEVKSSFPQLSQARLGLVVVTKIVLEFLIVAKLRNVAPVEL